ncbi:hypothetical protein CLOP_g5584, partial [Closterium sp. NIES-67]
LRSRKPFGPAFKRPWHRPAASPRGAKALRVHAAFEPRRQVQHRHRSRSLLAALHRSALRAPPLEESLAMADEAGGTRRWRHVNSEGTCAAVEAPSTPNRLASRLGVLILTAAAAAAAGAGMSAQAVQAEAVQAEAVQAEALQAPTAATPTGAPVPSAALAVPEADCQRQQRCSCRL